jgi:hypothetical protein
MKITGVCLVECFCCLAKGIISKTTLSASNQPVAYKRAKLRQ